MSLIQKIQEKGAWIIFIAIAVALIAFIAMDSLSSGGGLFKAGTTLAKVNGEDIDVQEFEREVYQIQQMQGNNTDAEDLRAEVYNYEIRKKVMQQQYAKLGLSLADNELNAYLFGNNPPQFLAQQFTDPQTGIYDANAARNYINQVKKAQSNPEAQQAIAAINTQLEQISEQLVDQKYQSLLMGAAHIPSWMVKKSVADANAIASISYLSVPYTTISDSAVKVSDEEIMTFVKKHKKQFEQKEGFRDISIVSFNAGPSSADSATQLATAQNVKQQFAGATDIASFVELQNTGTQYYQGYINEKEIKDPLKDTIIHQPIGGIVGPLVESGNIVLAKLVSSAPVADTVSARFLMVATHAPNQQNQIVQFREDSAALKRIDSAATLVRGGMNFDSLVVKYSDNQQNSRLDNITSAAMMQLGSSELSDFLLTGALGASKVIKIPNSGYILALITDKKGSSTGYKIARVIKPLSPSSETISAASSAANQFAANSRDAKSFDANAAKQGLTVTPVQGIRENDFRIGNLGNDRQLVKWINEAKVGEVSEPVQIGDAFVVAKLNNIVKPGLPNAATVRPYVEAFLKNEKKAKIIIDTKFKGNSLEAVSQAAGVAIAKADSISFYGQMLPGVGMEPKVVGASFNKTIQGKMSKPIAGNMGVFAIKGESVSAVPTTTDENVKQMLQQSLLQQMYQRSMNALVEAANIVDRRSKFY